jgi:hypothetical protein
MPIKRLSITNLGPFAGSKDWDLPVICLIQGGNGAGKSGLQACIKYIGERGHDPDMIHGNAEWGEVILTMDTGHQLRARVTANETVRSWRPSDGKRWIVNRQLIDEICAAAAYDPLRLLELSEREQAATLLKLAPVEMDPAEIVAALAGFAIPDTLIPDGANPLECVDLIHKHLYDQRKAVHSQAESLEAHADELRKAIPEKPAEGWGEQLKRLRVDKATADGALAAAKEAHNRRWREAKATAEQLRTNAYSQASSEYERKLKEIEAERLGAHNAAEAICADAMERARADGQTALDAYRATATPESDRLVAEISRVEALAEQETKAKGTQEALEAARAQALRKRDEWKTLDTAVDNLRVLRLKLADRLPIKNVLVREGRIVREQDGGLVPLSKWNTADRMALALRVGMMVANKAGFVIVDHVEAFDGARRKALYKSCTKYAEENGIQFILASVDPAGSKLSIEDVRL